VAGRFDTADDNLNDGGDVEAGSEREGVPHAVPSRRIGDYEIVASLGRGGAGEAFLALAAGPKGFRKLVVLKLLHPELEENLEVVDQFLDEARLAGRLNHPNIVPTLEVGLHEVQHFIAMAYLEGLPLGRVLAMLAQRGERIEPAIAARIAVELLDALAYAHSLRDFDGSPLHVVHRDVSPPNVFVCWDGSVKLLDFGIARAASRRASTDSGLIKGKFGYIAPEQASGEDVDRRADLWSAGVVLWEMLTGHRMFPARNDVGTLHALVAGVLTPVTKFAPDTPAGLVAVLDGVLQRDPDDRYRSADAMRDVLAAWLDEQPHAVTRDDVAAWLGDAFVGERERQQGLLRTCVGGARLGASATGSFHVAPKGPSSESRRISTLPPRPEPPRPKLALGPIAFALLAVAALVGIVVTSATRESASAVREERASEAGVRTTQLAVAPPVAPNAVDEAVAIAPPSPVETSPSELQPVVAPGSVRAVRRPTSESRGTEREGAGVESVEGAGLEDAEGAGLEGAVEEPTLEAATGWLTLDTTPWATVSLDGRVLGHTPLMRVELPAGQHDLLLENPERGIRRVYVVSVRAGETTARRLGL
jgi:eukaryotic-like serine/threonine-protein kinase